VHLLDIMLQAIRKSLCWCLQVLFFAGFYLYIHIISLLQGVLVFFYSSSSAPLMILS
jgi:hypothetical protein